MNENAMDLPETRHPSERSSTAVEDAGILAEIARGDLRRFDDLVDRYKCRLMSYIGHRVPDRHHAEDLVQESFLCLFRAARGDGYSGQASVSTWLFTIAGNCVTDYLRNPGQVGDDFNDRLRARMSEVFDNARPETNRLTLLTRSLTTWSWIMHSPISRVAAAVVFVLAVTAVALWFHGGGATPTLADYLEPILNAKTVTYMQTTELKGMSKATSTTKVMMLGTSRSRSEMELEMPDKSKHKTVHIWDGGQGKRLQLNTAKKRATVINYVNLPKDKRSNQEPFAGYRSMLLDARNKPEVKRDSLGEKEIDGRHVVGFRIDKPEAVVEVWGDPKTGLPVRIEITATKMYNTKITMSDFEFNVDLDESLFSVEPPAGYEVIVVKNTTSDGTSPDEKDLIIMFREYSESCGGLFPDWIDCEWITKTVSLQNWLARSLGQTREPREKSQQEHSDSQSKLRRGAQFALLLPPEADSHYAGRGVSLGTADTPIFWYRPKDSKTYRVIHADLSVREAETPPGVPDTRPARPELDLIEMFRTYSELSEGPFPNSLDMGVFLQVFIPKRHLFDSLDKSGKPRAQKEMEQAVVKLQRGLRFISLLPKEADEHYAGKGVSLGTADTPIFWYRPKDSKMYRIIHADLSVREDETPPSVPVTQPEQDLIDALRDYSELSGGPFPDSLDLQAMTSIVGKKDQEELTIQIFLEVCTPGKGELEVRRQKIEEIVRKLAPGEEKPNKEPMDKLTNQMFNLVDWEKLAPGKGTLNNEQKDKLIKARMEKVLKARMSKYQEVLMPKIAAATMKFLPGSTFVKLLPPQSDAHYAGKGVSFGAADRPIFWYRPKDSRKYRVIHADLSVREAETPPSVPGAQPVPATQSTKTRL